MNLAGSRGRDGQTLEVAELTDCVGGVVGISESRWATRAARRLGVHHSDALITAGRKPREDDRFQRSHSGRSLEHLM